MQKTIYIDTSVIVCLLFKQLDYQKLQTAFVEAEELISSSLILAETQSACVREKFPPQAGSPLLNKISLVNPEHRMTVELAEIFKYGYLRGADAYHLACALYADNNTRELVFLSRDNKQQALAKKLGFTLG